MKAAPADRLTSYRGKRDFTRTTEPEAGIAGDSEPRFVVQRHDARRAHYDLRLELDGVLLSWAVPNGPSVLSGQKRLAVRTEDHPLQYLSFEGVIPKGEYGGGTMIVWDHGHWRSVHDIQKSMSKGHLEFELFGERLKGRWHLVRTRPNAQGKEQWLLMKAADEHQRVPPAPDLIQEYDTSVLSGKIHADLAHSDAVRADHKSRVQVTKARTIALPDVSKLKGARKALLPLFLEPCLASLAASPPSGSQWVHEVKFDGYRLQARIDGEDVKLLTRSGLDWTKRFSTIADAVRKLAVGSAQIDGEVVVEDGSGIPSFNALVADLKDGRQERFRYYLFDLLYLNGVSLQGASFADRKQALANVFGSAETSAHIALSEHFMIDGPKFFEHVSRLGLEGMISKRLDAPYRAGRSKDWLKTKCVQSQEFVIVGYVPATTARRAIGSLVLGYYDKGKLVHAGRVGTGFSQAAAEALFATLEAIRVTTDSGVRNLTKDAAKGVRWVEPKLIAEVEYRGWSADDLLRHSSFRGLREDKDALEIVRESLGLPNRGDMRANAAITHPERLLWPEDGITKQGLADYYAESVKWIMPHLANRPLSLVRCPEGIAAECFFAKHAWAGLSKAVRQVETGGSETLLAVDNVEGLLALVQGSVLEIHPWGSTLADLERPDRLIFDLAPGDDVSWDEVIAAAQEVRERLRTLWRLESFAKTTGGKGLHVVAPIVPSLDWDEAKAATKKFAESMAADSTGRYVSTMAKVARKGKIFIDYLRNGRGATAVAAYSTRARAGATVSTPLGWHELSPAIRSDHFRLSNIGRRLAYLKSDPWADFAAVKQRLTEPSARRRTTNPDEKIRDPIDAA